MFEDTDNGHTCYCENCEKLQRKLNAIKELVKEHEQCAQYSGICKSIKQILCS